jgi:hydrogenase maturation protein HypF
MVLRVCEALRSKTGENNIALSGGVFANLLLLNDCATRLEDAGFEVYINREVPTNDSGICLGQAWLCRNR